MQIYTGKFQSPLGEYTLASDGENITGLWLKGQKYYAATIDGEAVEKPELPILQKGAEWVSRYFRREKPEIGELPLAPAGSAFRREVWKLLCDIPYGEVVTYGSLAAAVALKTGKSGMSAQAVGGAVGHNPISIIIPCHRVVGSGGSLTGYAGGVEKKFALLEREGLNMEHFYIPTRGTAL